MITREKKQELVERLRELYESSSGIIITEYRALSMEEKAFL